ncbi:MAG: CDP-alcohol phosphatidyltransferase family protein [Xanthomonadales bacterium]|nr:CDP-alcohol phosphatidyltransferase family protein [Xanthomonadales bacterium]
MSIYALKPAFQNLLRPLVRQLHAAGVTANQVTSIATLASVGVGALLWWQAAGDRRLFLLLPLWMFLRMALNAIDGMLAREFGQKSRLGAMLNELGDVVSDAALYAPLALVAPFQPVSVAVVIVLATISEFAGALGPSIGAERRYDGPMGKSDRAAVFGALGLWIGIGGTLPGVLGWLMPLIAVAIAWTIVRRVRNAMRSIPPAANRDSQT